MMNVSRSAYYAWLKRPARIITLEQLNLYRKAKQLFEKSRNSLGYRELRKKLRSEGFNISDYGVQKLMATLGLVVTQRVAYKVTTKRKHSDAVADNLLNQNFNPVAPNQVWAGDVTYLRTGEGWMYLAIVMDLYSRRIVGWHIDKRMTTNLVSKAMMKAYNLRQPPKGLVFHSDRGTEYCGKIEHHDYQLYLAINDIDHTKTKAMSPQTNGICERFHKTILQEFYQVTFRKKLYGSLEELQKDLDEWMVYYNNDRTHQGKMCCGRTPLETLLDGKSIWAEKNLTQI